MRVARVALVGESQSGKSALLHRCARGAFPARSEPTLGLDYDSITLRQWAWEERAAPADYKLQVWDTAGQERFRALCGTYIRQCGVLWVCIDSSDMASFRAARDYWWPRVVSERTGAGDAAILLTKMDVAVAEVCDAVRGWVGNRGITVLETSAKTGAGTAAVCRWTVGACHRFGHWNEIPPPRAPRAGDATRCCAVS